MKMSNKKNYGTQWYKSFISTSLLLLVCSFSNAKNALQDDQLSELTSNSNNVDLKSIQRALRSIDQPLEKQQQESEHLIDLNVQSIQPQSMDEAVVLEYQLQKKRMVEQASLNEKRNAILAIIGLFDTDNTSDNLKRYHDDGITVEMMR